MRAIILATVGALVAGCGDGSGPGPAPRTFLMGFSAISPRLDSTAGVIIAINNWVPLADYYRAKGLALVFTVDATDGLNRAAEAPELVSAGRSITDTMIQRLYREWAFAVANKIRPDYLGLAAETNLIRQLAPDSVYQGLVTMANAVVAQIRAARLPSKLHVSVQVETAWGRSSGPYQGIGRISPTFRSSRRSAYRLRFKCRDQIGT